MSAYRFTASLPPASHSSVVPFAHAAYNSPMPPTTADQQSNSIRDRVQSVIDLIRPAVQADGGDIEVVDITPDNIVQIRFHGACHGCPSSTMTLQDGIVRILREKVPEVTQVVPVP